MNISSRLTHTKLPWKHVNISRMLAFILALSRLDFVLSCAAQNYVFVFKKKKKVFIVWFKIQQRPAFLISGFLEPLPCRFYKMDWNDLNVASMEFGEMTMNRLCSSKDGKPAGQSCDKKTTKQNRCFDGWCGNFSLYFSCYIWIWFNVFFFSSSVHIMINIFFQLRLTLIANFYGLQFSILNVRQNVIFVISALLWPLTQYPTSFFLIP